MKVQELFEGTVPEYQIKAKDSFSSDAPFSLWNGNKKVLWISNTRSRDKQGLPGQLKFKNGSKNVSLDSSKLSDEQVQNFEAAGIPVDFVKAYEDTQGFQLLIDKTNARVGTTNAEIKKQEALFKKVTKGSSIKAEFKNILQDK